jgi:glycine/D-amino acid oxidase-like deaminating enzyme
VKAKVAVIGGGVMGASVAMHLADRLDPVADPLVLFERAPRLAAGSSGRSGAILRQHYADLEVARMARNSLAEYGSFQLRTGRDIGFRETGVLTLAGPRAPEWVERVVAAVARLSDAGIRTRLVDAAEIRKLVPGIEVADDAVGAWEPNGGFVDPVATVEAFAALARTRGAATRLGVEVTAIRLDGGRVTGLETSEGPVEAEQVVVVAGPWSRAILERAGIELPLRAIRPEQYFVAMPGGGRPADPRGLSPAEVALPLEALEAEPGIDPLARIEREADERDAALRVPHPVLIDLELGFYCRCEPARPATRVGRVEYDGDAEVADPGALDEEVGEELRRWARGVLVERMPIYSDHADLEPEAALYTLTPDAQAVIGAVPGTSGLFVATGFSGHGFKLAPSVGLGVTQMLLGEPVTAFEPAFFSPERFAKGTPEWGGRFGL